VTTTADELDPNDGVVSLREALNQANADAPGDTIVLPAGTYTVTIPNAGGPEDANASGSFDIRQSLTILGAGAGATVIDGNGPVIGDRVFAVVGPVTAQFGSGPSTGLTIRNGSANPNDDFPDGGGIRATAGGSVQLAGCVVSDNTARDGGGIRTDSGTATLTDSTVSGNMTTALGAVGISTDTGAVTLTGSAVRDNLGFGSGIGTGGALTLTDSIVSHNDREGIVSGSGDVTLTRSIISDNGLDGIQSLGTSGTMSPVLTVTDCTISGNGGSGIVSFGRLVVTGSTIRGNTGLQGGGILFEANNPDSASVTVINSTISGNSGQEGGGIYLGGGVPLVQLTNVTLTKNTAGTGGGGIFVGASCRVTMTNTIVAGNTSTSGGPDLAVIPTGTFEPSAGHTLIGDGSSVDSSEGAFLNGVNGNLVGTDLQPLDPLLGPLADNGGITLTQALAPGSPAIDAGQDGVVSVDQRGVSRPQGAHTDIGAFELEQDQFVVAGGGTNTVQGSIAGSSGKYTLLVLVETVKLGPLQLTLPVTAGRRPAGARHRGRAHRLGLLYHITVTNVGPAAATDVVLTDLLSRNARLVLARFAAGTCTRAGRNLVCVLGSLARGGTAVLTLGVLPRRPGVIRNLASVRSATPSTLPDPVAATVIRVRAGPPFFPPPPPPAQSSEEDD
jgi:uncharacterized repeat protein (TIGR01451 family)/CSLREA domain-containing protein